MTIRLHDSTRDTAIETYIHNGNEVTIYQDALLMEGSPTFFATVAQTVVGETSVFSVEEAKAMAESYKPRKRKKT